ncbi:5-oxoprolinase (ATP-hydrolyzing) [Rhodopirellula maiorica SM1]|uniref:5-oxoprolinase (ATP-hydrolyzing) n=1 Tax=Rhodopirellula maiorica SM1 TaxID=1265738 RepID=M5S3I3_9BACT|nr:oxoprolinase family protein [Rhodopirellula maiorica]EMI20739.1 5-oxoprolinase (ATP-hydrolyzing) [Rhodopirellula maiorica SM1]
MSSNSITQVWADVGGTFTDCFAVVDDVRRSTKVLSSGKVRVKASRCERSQHEFKLDSAATEHPLPDDFWNGCRALRLRGDGVAVEIGTVTGFDARENRITVEGDDDPKAEAEVGSGSFVMELDARLEAPVLASRLLLGCRLCDPLPALAVRLGTTRGTNALLTRSGANTTLLVTEGFADVLRIGEQDRPELFALAVKKHAPLTEHVVEVPERIDAKGNVLRSLDESALRETLLQIKASGTESLSICLMHAHVNDTHERIAQQMAAELGFDQVSRSSEVAPLIKLVSRAETTTLDAYLNPILASYVSRVWDQFGGRDTCRLQMMTSGGNLVAGETFRGRDSVLSGPAGGVVALGAVAKSIGSKAAIGLDMGGTSTDVSRYTGQVGRCYESRVAGLRVLTPMMDIRTVAAGGGSICDVVAGRLAVGPASAGADPGPACYGRGGPLTITDINLLLNRLPVDRFPFPLDELAAKRRIEEVAKRLPDSVEIPSMETLAEGFLQIAVTHMAEAVRTVSTAEGNDVRQMTLVGFGGAAGQHLCRVADSLKMSQIIDHPDASMLSALGMGLADIGRVVTRGVYSPLDDASSGMISRIVDELRSEAESLISEENVDSLPVQYSFECDVRYRGTESSLPIAYHPMPENAEHDQSDLLAQSESLGKRFNDKHLQTFGYNQPGRPLELVAIRCEAKLLPSTSLDKQTVIRSADSSSNEPPKRWSGCDRIERSELREGDIIATETMIISSDSTLIVEPHWVGRVLAGGVIELRRESESDSDHDATPENDAVLLEVVARRLQGIADSMGEVLRRTAVSVNVKERRDYSCAVFRGDGALIANAPHVPVHLGAMGHTVRRLIRVYPAMSPGDCYLSNDPFSGGSHLPDITAVTPVFCDRTIKSGRPDFFVASRAHHAEIGGRTPGSMPPDATSLAEEGVLIRDSAMVREGVHYEDDLRALLNRGRYPSRNAEENLADLAAQRAAGEDGVRALIEMSQTYSVSQIDYYMQRLLQVAGDTAQRWIHTLPKAPMSFTDALDDGTVIAVTLHREGDRLKVDFTGTASVHPFGFNATKAIVTAVVLYVVRMVSGSNLPLCDGVLRDIDVVIPSGLLNPPADEDPAKCAAVVAGNVETSQRVVDVLLGALGVAAASQGTMNNVLIGDETFGFYETIGGGSGATADHDGADAVHTHMTNTRITDPEVMESRLPLRLHRFAIRHGSGGAGLRRGGDGMIREFEFLKPLTLSLITGRRTRPPYGAAGGDDAAVGKNTLIRSGKSELLPWAVSVQVDAGDRLIIETPGGGGWGRREGGGGGNP